MKRLFTLSLALCLAFTAWTHNIGDTAPNFTLKALDGSTVSLSDYKGKVIMAFFFGYNCPSCIAAGPKVQATILDTFKDNPNFVALGIDMWDGNKTGVQNFKDASRLDMPMLLNGSGVRTSWETERDRLFVIDANGKFAFIGTSVANNDAENVKTTVNTSLENISTALQEVTKGSGKRVQVYPNPVKESAQITLKIDASSHVNISIYDLSGAMVHQLYNGSATAGQLQVNFNRNDLPNGVYFYRVTNENSVSTGRLLLQ